MRCETQGAKEMKKQNLYNSIWTSEENVFVDIYVGGILEVLRKARVDYPELKEMNLRVIGEGQAREKHVNSYSTN